MPDKLTPQQFAAKIRAKYPGAYDSVPDAELTQRVIAKYPQYKDAVSFDTPAPQAQQPQPQAEVPWYEKPLVSGDTIMRLFGGDAKAARGRGANYLNPDSPTASAVVRGLNGAVVDTADTLSGFTSPVGLGTMVAGGLGKVGKAAQALAAPVFTAMGINQAADSNASPVDVLKAVGYGTGLTNTPPNATPEQIQQLLGGAGTAAAGAAGTVSELKNVLRSKPGAGVLAKKMQERVEGGFTRQEILDAARKKGVNPDIEQATGSKVAGAVKKANQYSLTGQGSYETNRINNLDALEKWATDETAKYSPHEVSREYLGNQISAKLKEDLAGQKNAAASVFEDLDRRVGTNSIDGTPTIEAEARKIVSEMSDYYKKHPELKPKQAWSIIENLAERPKVDTVNPQATAPGLMDINGNPQYATGTITKQASKAHFFSWSELHQLRSDLMDVYRNNPEIIKGKSEAWLQRMVGTIDNALTDASTGLSPSDLAQFRQANTIWENIKSTYDNPQHPFFNAVRPQFESQVSGMLSNKTPELARQVRQTIGSLDGQFQRQFVETLLKTKDGQLELGKLDSKLKGIPDDFLKEMVGEEGAKNLRLLGKTAKMVKADANPSGTAKVGIPATEIVNAFANPVVGGAEMAANYGAAKAINSPKWLDYLTKIPAKDAARLRLGKLTQGKWWMAPAVAGMKTKND